MRKVVGWGAIAFGARAQVYVLFDDGTWKEVGYGATHWDGVVAFTLPCACEPPQRKLDVAAGDARHVVEYALNGGDVKPTAWTWELVKNAGRIAVDVYMWSRACEENE